MRVTCVSVCRWCSAVAHHGVCREGHQQLVWPQNWRRECRSNLRGLVLDCVELFYCSTDPRVHFYYLSYIYVLDFTSSFNFKHFLTDCMDASGTVQGISVSMLESNILLSHSHTQSSPTPVIKGSLSNSRAFLILLKSVFTWMYSPATEFWFGENWDTVV